jgi:hypothetical protein
MLTRIMDGLVFTDVVVYDNSLMHDRKTAGRYYALREFPTRSVVYFQDDDVLVPKATQLALCGEYTPGVVVANYGHGENPDGYDDLPLVCGGAILDADLPWRALTRYLAHYPMDEGFLYEADFVAGVLYEKWRHVRLPFYINMSIAQAPERLCNQPWQRDLKLQVTEQARSVRDGVLA